MKSSLLSANSFSGLSFSSVVFVSLLSLITISVGAMVLMSVVGFFGVLDSNGGSNGSSAGSDVSGTVW